MSKKIVSLLLAACMMFSVCACGNSKETQAPEKSSEVQSSEVAQQTQSSESVEEEKPLYPLVDEPITETGVVVGTPQGLDYRTVWNKVSEITNVNFEWIIVDNEALNTFLAGDWEFDFIHSKNISNGIISDYGVLGGKFADYNDYLDLMPHLQKAFEDYPEAVKFVTETNGAIYELPQIGEGATGTQIRTYYRTDLLDKYNIPVPTTTEELYQALKTYKEKNGTAGFSGKGLREDRYWGAMLYCAFGTSLNADFEDDGTGKVVFNRTSDQYKHYLEYMHKLYSEGLIQQEYMTNDASVCLGLATNGDTVFYDTEAHSLSADIWSDGNFYLDVLAPLSSEYSDDREVPGYFTFNKGGLFLNAESEHLDVLVQALDIMYATEEVVEGSGLHGTSFCYGIDGVDYIKYDDGTYELVWPEKYESMTDYQYKELIWENAGRDTDLANYVTRTPGNAQARQKGFIKNISPYESDASKLYPTSFLKFTTEEQDVITNRYTDINSYVKEMRDKFIQGVVDFEKGWDDYCATIEAMHIDEVLEAHQAAYDRWNQN